MIKNSFVLFLVVLLSACSNTTNKDKLFKKFKTVCSELKLSNCVMETRYAADSKSGKNEELVLGCQESIDVAGYYKETPEFVLGKIAYEMELFIDSLNLNTYSGINIEALINNKKVQRKYSIEDLKKIHELTLIAESFIDVSNSKSHEKIDSLIDKKFISDSAMNATFNGMEQMSKCGPIEKSSVIGIRFDKIAETNKEVIIIEKYLKRKMSQETLSFYFLSETNKIIFIGIKSSSNCN